MEAPHQPAQRLRPFGLMSLEEIELTLIQRGPARDARTPPAELHLDPDGFAARLVLLGQPIGLDQPHRVVVGVVANLLKIGVVGTHGTSRTLTTYPVRLYPMFSLGA